MNPTSQATPWSRPWLFGAALGFAWACVEVGAQRLYREPPWGLTLGEVAVCVVAGSLTACLVARSARRTLDRGTAAWLCVAFFLGIAVHLLHPFLIPNVSFATPLGAALTAVMALALLLPLGLVWILVGRGTSGTAPVAAIPVAALSAGAAFWLGRTHLVHWPPDPDRGIAGLLLLLAAESVTVLAVFRLPAGVRTTAPVWILFLCVTLFPGPDLLRDVPKASHPQAEGRPPVILISLDTTRPDHLSFFGYPLPTSPRLDAFLETCVVFPDAYATSSWTLPSHASAFTGLYAAQHGAHHVPGARAGVPPQPLRPDSETLAELFRNRGYATAAVSANRLAVEPNLGLSRGFEEVHAGLRAADWPVPYNALRSVSRSLQTRWIRRAARMHWDAKEVTTRASTWVEDHAGEPFFLFVNYIDPHHPYVPPEPLLPDGAALSGGELWRWQWERLEQGESMAAYDGEIRYMDTEPGRFLDRLDSLGILETAVVVIFTDHGEAFGEIGFTGHGREVHEGVLRSLLAVRFPGQARGSRDPELMNLADIPALILHGLEGALQKPARTGWWIAGEKFLTLKDTKRAPRFPGAVRLVAARNGSWKAVDHGDGIALFDLSTDPGELRNVASAHPDTVRAAREFFDRWYAANDYTPGDVAGGTRSLQETLKGLGYVN